MQPTILFAAALLGLLDASTTERPTAAAEGSAGASKSQPAPPSAADSIVAAAFSKGIDTRTENEKGPATSGVSASSFIAPGLALLGLAGLAVGLSRRRRSVATSIRIVESVGLGPRRSLVIADVLGERLVLGVSEAGVAVLSTRPSPDPAAAAPEAEPVYFAPPARAPVAPMSFFQRLSGRSPQVPFEEVLGESIEDQELRAKLAQGVRGIVP